MFASSKIPQDWGRKEKKKEGRGGAQKSESLAHINGRKHKCGPKVGKHILPQQDREDLGSTQHIELQSHSATA